VTLVIDASITLAWCFEDEQTDRSEAALSAIETSGALVPGLWRYEVINGLVSAVRRGRLSQSAAEEALDLLAALPIEVDDVVVSGALLSLASRAGLTAYDAAYLEVAARHGATLVTEDRALEKAARKAGVSLFR
jgi:predicted nucleic acid-binding protein